MNWKSALVLLLVYFLSGITLDGASHGRNLPYYSILGASYQALEPVERHIESLHGKGYEAVYEHLEIPRQGHRYRIYIGRYDNQEAAQQAADRLKTDKLITGFRIVRMMLPAAATATRGDKMVKARWKFDEASFPVIDPFARKQTKGRQPSLAPQPEQQRPKQQQPDSTAPQQRAGTVGQGQQPVAPTAVPEPVPLAEKKADPPAGEAGSALLDQARSDFQARRYDQALVKLQSILNQTALPEGQRGQALRLAADCYYFMGLRGQPQYLLLAVERYKMILARYPDPAAGNDLIYFHLAKSNESLSFSYEATGAWERLVNTYPTSELIPEAIFGLGVLFNQMGKSDQAIEKLYAYLKKYPAAEHAKAAHFMIGDCYYFQHKEGFAGQWYDEVRKKWPDLDEIPAKTLINMGHNYFNSGKFSSSLQVFSHYHNLYPHDELGKDSLYMMARNAEAMGETAMALSLYRLFIDKHPQDGEVEACLMAMAALGIEKPGIKYPFHVLPVEAYEKPLTILDGLLAKKPGGEKEAALLLLKGDALVKNNRLKEGFVCYAALINRFPQGRSSEEGRKKLRLQVRSLVNEGYEKGDYLAVSDIYFQGHGRDLVPWDDFTTAGKIGDSLLRTGLQDEAAIIYEALKKIYRDREQEKVILLALAKVDLAKNKDEAAEEKLLSLLAGGEKNQGLRNEIKITLGDLYYKKRLWAKASQLYADVLPAGGKATGALYRSNGRALQAAKLSDKAIVNYLNALKDYEQHPQSYPADILTDIYGGLGDAYYDLQRYKEGMEAYRQALAHTGEGNADVRKWLTYMIGKGSVLLRDFTGAEKSFALVKANAVGEFWPKVTDYILDRNRGAGNAGNQNE